MPNRQIINGEPYRYAYQGQEKDPETGKEAFQLRLWDGRIGRWLTTDPKGEFSSPYLGMGNNPIRKIDPDGGSTDDIINIDKSTGKTTVTKAAGDDVVRIIDNGKVIDEYTYGQNGSFIKDNKLFTGEFINTYDELDIGQSIVFKNSSKAFEFFKFASKSDVEFSYNKYSNFGNVSVVATSHDKGAEALGVTIKYKLLTTNKDIKLIASWHSHPGNYDRITRWPAYPSGFHFYGTIDENAKGGDRAGYIWNKKYFPNRTPEYNFIFIPSVNKVVKFNQSTFTVK